MSRTNELRMMARVAQMYHVEKLRQSDIAAHLRISQATVSRMLKKAQEEEIVRTTVVAPPGTFAGHEAGLRQHFNLSEAIVVECSEERDGAIMARIGEGAAHFLEALFGIKGGMRRQDTAVIRHVSGVGGGDRQRVVSWRGLLG